MAYSSVQISDILLKADKTIYKLGDVAYENMFDELDEAYDYERDIIFIYKKAVEYGDNYFVGTLKLDQIVERLAAKLNIYDYGTLAPIYVDVYTQIDQGLNIIYVLKTTALDLGPGLTGSNNFTQSQIDIDIDYTYLNNVYVIDDRTLTINGVTYDLSANRTWSLNLNSVTGQGSVTTNSITVGSVYLTNMTAGSGALYYNAGSNRVTLANYNAGGSVYVEVNGGQYSAVFGSDLSFTSYGTIAGVFNNATVDTDKFIVSDGGVLKYRTGTQLLSDIGGQPAGNYVPESRTLTINGTTYDLSANRSWSVGTVTSVNMTVPTGFTISGNPITGSGTLALAMAAGYSIPTTASQANWNTAYNDSIVSAAVTGTTTKTLTLNQQDGGTVVASWTDYDTAPVTSVFGRTGAILAQSGDYTTTLVTEGTNLYYTDARSRAAITLTTIGTSGAATYSSLTGVLNIPNYGSVLTGYVPYTGATQDLDLGTYGLISDFVRFNPSSSNIPSAEGVMSWDNSNGTVSLSLKGNTYNLPIGESLVARVVNNTGAQLNRTDYRVVRVTSAQGQRLAVSLAQANNDANSAETIGIVCENIANNQEGFVVNVGQVTEINTTGSLQGETWADGDSLYLSATTPGVITNIKPVAPNHGVRIGYVEYAHSQHGKIYVKIDNGYELDELHDVEPTPYVNKGVLYRDTATNLWKSATIQTLLGYTPANQATTLTINGTTYDLSANRTWSVGTITSLTGEATASGTGAVSVTLTNSAVIGKVLTGLNLSGGGTIVSTDSILQAFGKVQNQISALVGGVMYKGVWDANVNSPSLTSSVGNKGDYYIVNVAGSTNLNGITDWKIGDWAIFNGATWDKVDNTDAVSSVNSFTGAVSLTTANIPEVTNLYYLDSRARAALSFTAGSGNYSTSTGVITIPTNTNHLTNGAGFITLTSLSASSPLSYNNLTGGFSISQASGSTNGYLSSTDWTTFNNKQNALGYTPVTNARTLTINGTTYDLTADRSWSVGTHTGSLTSGYIPKATGTTTLTDSLIYETGTAVLIGTQTQGSSKFMVYSATADNHYQAIGSAPSLRFADTVVSPTYTGIIGLATASNHFIIGSAAGDMVLSNNTNSAGNFLFGTGTTERMRINATTGNISINNTNNTFKLDVTGTVRFTGQLRLESTITNGTYTYTLPSATGTIALVGGAGVGTVTSIATTGPITGGTITSTGTIGITQATTSTDGYLSSTDWNTFNNKQSALTNPVTGTGTTNYLPKFTGSTTIGNSQVFDNGTNVGINEATPSEGKLVINNPNGSTNNGTTGNTLYLKAQTANANLIRFSGAIATDLIFGRFGNQDSFSFGTTGGSEWMRLTSTGLGIGTTSPAYKLDVNGTGRFTASANTYAGGSLILSAASGGTSSYITNVAGLLAITNNSSVDQLILNASGNLGLGVTPSAWTDLTAMQFSGGSVSTYSNYSMFLSSNAHYSTGWKYTASTTAAQYSLDGNVHKWFTAPSGTAGNAISFTQAMTLTAGGDLALGLTGPQQRLHVHNSGTSYVHISNSTTGTGGSDGADIGFFSGETSLNIINRENADMIFSTNNTEKMRLTSTGLGIGTTSPSVALDVVGVGRFASTSYSNVILDGTNATGWGNNIAFRSQGTDFGYVGSVGSLLGNTTKDMTIWATSGNGIRFYTNGNNLRALIDTSGNLGLGSGLSFTSWSNSGNIDLDSVYLSLSSSGTYGGVVANNAYYNSGWKYKGANYATLYQTLSGEHRWLNAGVGGAAGNAITFTQAMTLDASGRLGIGSTSPNYNLSVYQSGSAGNNYVEGNVQIGGTTSGLGTIINYAAQNSGYSNISNLNNTGGSNARINFGFGAVSSGTPANTVMTLNQSGNVGIGTSSPSSKLHVQGSGYVIKAEATGSDSVYIQTINGSYDYIAGVATSLGYGLMGMNSNHALAIMTNGSERMRITSGGNLLLGGTTDNGGKLQVNNTARIGNNSGGVVISGDGGSATINTDIASDLRLGTNNTERLRITSGGNVGIGTTSPQSGVKLDVYGAAAVAGGSEGLRIGNVGDNSAYDNVKLWYTGFNSGAPRIYLTPRTTPGSGVINTFFHLQNTNGTSTASNNTMGLIVDGNVGIGTSSPTSRLQSNNSSTYNSSTPTGSIIASNLSSNNAIIDIGIDGTYLGYIQSRNVSNTTFYNLLLNPLGGNVGIANTSPASFLHIGTYGSSGKYIDSSTLPTTPSNHLLTLAPPSTGGYYGGGIGWSEGTNTAASINAYDDGAGGALALVFATGTNSSLGERMRITSGGNVLIGTTTNGGYLLDAAGQIRSISGAALVVAMSTAPANDAVIAARWTGGTGMEMRYNPNTAVGFIDNTYPATAGQVFGDIQFRINSGSAMTHVMTVKSNNQSVGIGLTGPTQKLSVGGNQVFTNSSVDSVTNAVIAEISSQARGYSNQGANMASIQFRTASDAWYWGEVAFLTNSTDGTNPAVAATERMRIKYNGNVGIGSSSPAEKLELSGTSNIYAKITSTNSGNAGVRFNSVGTREYGIFSDGALRFYDFTDATERMRITSGGDLLVGTTSGSSHIITKAVAVGTSPILQIYGNNTGTNFFNCDGNSSSATNTGMRIGQVGATGRSINAGGTINASGADYAEYMTKAVTDIIEKGDVVGVNSNGMLTNIFNDAISFVVKSTDPSYVGADKWGVNLEGEELEKARQNVDRIAFSGQVPCNVFNANVGDYIIPINVNGKIKGQAISNPTFEQYQKSVGKVWKIMDDGRAWIAIKIG